MNVFKQRRSLSKSTRESEMPTYDVNIKRSLQILMTERRHDGREKSKKKEGNKMEERVYCEKNNCKRRETKFLT